MLNQLRAWVSENRLRYNEGGYNLDLSYITDRIIAMSFPAEGFEGMYRNSLKEVKRFLNERHSGHYKVYNLRSEKSYKATAFDVPLVSDYAFDDHQPPPLKLLRALCRDAATWLQADPDNVVAIHCKAGKGRTGTAVAALLLYMHVAQNVDEAIHLYGIKRTTDGKGLTVPSQIRYVHYFASLLKNPEQWDRDAHLRLFKVKLHPIPGSIKHDTDIVISINDTVFSAKDSSSCDIKLDFVASSVIIELPKDMEVSNDFKISFCRGNKKTPLFHFWLNAAFVSPGAMVLLKNDLDGPVNSLPDTFEVTLSTTVP
ncbi:protein-tyrosine phosphatase-like protein [Syncephalastrum racemosum]|uniref:Phosphatidylinositol 3,4,5-trisphosphate 3-phosphatase and dual-specificity protein phosphatase PTEN n=1 Tax=Syncephalastrum racemosum TaxID=13706 RepID=A0A1X2H8B5_SYNRA|nr:protein-tyrosine phosphatase-like protein [Syncephalastrum racemosum]